MAVSGSPPPPAKVGQARTRLARAAVVAAARELFVERGYGSTTIEAISERSDVPAPTVYRLFSSKHGILKALVDVSIVGDDQQVPMGDRPEVRSLLASHDPAEQLAGFVAISAQINARVAPIYGILVGAAAADPDAAALLDELTHQRQQGQRAIARALARHDALGSGMRERDAADLIHAFLSPELYRLLVVDRGWAPKRYAAWLEGTLTAQLLPPGGTA